MTLKRAAIFILTTLVPLLGAVTLSAQGVAGEYSFSTKEPVGGASVLAVAQGQVDDLLVALVLPDEVLEEVAGNERRSARRLNEWVGGLRTRAGETARTLQEMQDQILLSRGASASLSIAELETVRLMLLELLEYSRRSIPTLLSEQSAAFARGLLQTVESTVRL